MIHNNYVASGVLRLDNGFEEELQIADSLWVGVPVTIHYKCACCKLWRTQDGATGIQPECDEGENSAEQYQSKQQVAGRQASSERRAAAFYSSMHQLGK